MKTLRFISFGLMALMFAISVACSSDENGTEPNPLITPVDTIVESEPEPLSPELRPVLTDGKRWVYGDAASYKVIRDEWVAGDTVYDGLAAKIIGFEDYNITDAEKEFYGKEFVLMEQDGKIYQEIRPMLDGLVDKTLAPSKDFFRLNWNLLADPGDIYETFDRIEVESRGTIIIMGKTLRAVKVRYVSSVHSYFINHDYWVEGIGSIVGRTPDYSTVRPSQPNFSHHVNRKLLECYDGETKIFDHKEFDESTYKPD